MKKTVAPVLVVLAVWACDHDAYYGFGRGKTVFIAGHRSGLYRYLRYWGHASVLIGYLLVGPKCYYCSPP